MKFRIAFVAAAILAIPFGSASAAPQMLGLVADSGEQKLNCVAGTCSVEVSAICLQEERDIPSWGTAYRAVDPTLITLVSERADGSRIRKPIGPDVSFHSARGSWAVTVSVPEKSLEAFGGKYAAIEIGGRVALKPVAVDGDPQPQTDTGMAATVLAFRNAGDDIFGPSMPDLAAAHVMNGMINALPGLTLDDNRPLSDLLHQTYGSQNVSEVPGMAEVTDFLQVCKRRARTGDRDDIRECLELGHDGFISSLNQRYWDSLAPGV